MNVFGSYDRKSTQRDAQNLVVACEIRKGNIFQDLGESWIK